jgi:hypothetical protein
MGFVAPAPGVPAPAPQPGPFFADPPPARLTPLELEIETRHVLNRWLDMVTTVNAPPWQETLFRGKPIRLQLPTPPAKSLDALDQVHQAMPGSGPAASAKQILDTLQKARPRGEAPKTIVGRKPLPPPRDAMAGWLRRVFLLTAGPAALRLLASAGQLAPGDVTIIEAAYPKGLDKERMDSVSAATSLTAAAMRNGHQPDLPMWLNDQLLVLMGEEKPADVWQALYGSKNGGDVSAGGNGAQGPSPSAKPSSIVTNAAPGTTRSP